MFNPSLPRAVRLALTAPGVGAGAVLLGCFALPAAAQQPEAGSEVDKLETIVVTGSRIRRVDLETASPVFVIDKGQIEKTGKLTVGDLLQTMPTIAGGATATNGAVNNGGGTGAATIDLRGLGTARTLILVNGRRLAGPAPDVNAIPINLIERVEVLKDGASAIYGSDAIGGVVNFILRKDYQGIEFAVDYGISDADDGQRKGVTMTLGHTSDKGSLMVGVNYNKQDAVSAADRDYSAEALYLSSGSIVAGGSSRTPRGRIFLPSDLIAQFNCPPNAAGSVTRIPGSSGGSLSDYKCYDPASDAFNFQAVGNLQLTPQERGSLFVVGNYRLSDNVEAYIEAFHNKTRAAFAIAPLPFDARNDNVLISRDNVYNPFGIDFGRSGDNDSGNAFFLRLQAIGNRRAETAVTTDQINLGLRGGFGDTSWQWDANFTYGHFSQFRQFGGYIFQPALSAAVGPSFIDANGVPTCGTPTAPIAGCVPVNPFNPEETPEAFSLLEAPYRTNTLFVQREAEVNANGELFELPAGVVSLAVGASYRKEYQRFTPDFLTTSLPPDFTNCQLSQETCTSPIVGGFDVKELYGEAFIPVLRDVAFAKALNLTIGTRYSKYSTFGNSTNSKLGIEWRPLDDVLLRGTIAEVFRAPTISNLFAAPASNAPTFRDPCIGVTSPVGANANIDRACENVPRDGSFGGPPNGQTTGLVAGNPNLKPEQGKAFTWGVVYDPSWLEGLSTSVDLWRFALNDNISALDVNTVALQCFTAGNLCDFIHRFEADGQVFYIDQPTLNLGRLDAKGVDFSIKYRLPETPIGTFRVGLDATYTMQFNQLIRDTQGNATGTIYAAGQFNRQLGNYARLRGLGTLNWELGNFDASWTARYIHGFDLGTLRPGGDSADGTIPNVVVGYGASTYHNLQFGYQIEPINARIELGVDNAFDKQPPILFQNNVTNGNTDPVTFDTVGRYYFARFSVKF
ncbi:MAG TPA: TonB-dependent receptor [Tahibacter sp.]|uniref:TonB-dependent receptor plug domain-containing protein n=1 Tax=Tahibacter sp. TaxID=2056211 RepID=UPI002BFE8C4A|nr:TonB-dependent receptor [Tahibacter sp.]HSX62332.1 TonB-dependent receptor [Tahibacter sp.]